MKLRNRIFKIVSLIPRGSVTTYKAIADAVKIKNSRLIGSILHTNTDPKNVPCHRVIRSDGGIADGYAFGGAPAQRKKLENEDITFTNDRVAVRKHFWQPERFSNSPQLPQSAPELTRPYRD
ncbi:MAG: Methylated-DNA/protein-cysteinemethyltransferase [Parcubacteria group bacterium GW2011_GWC2_44_17]|nr:MAG: Methylated-DNA/protein-cysteinemethyltransferase [Parcubacteria group bacterium GW2011_GWC2_44_17]HCA67370.1 cysteine methyltransferase [Candidatus Jacksonbacteria bacterium]HCE86452.1 cysteine methyltransferase [Candidatus Jacksonbacteria bacterium]